MSDDEERENHTVTEDGDTTATKTTNDDRLFAMLIYLTSFFTTIFGPLLIWLLKREDSKYIDFHGKEYFNFVISYTIYGFASGVILMFGFVFTFKPVIGFIILGVGVLVVTLLAIISFVFIVIAAVKAYSGVIYKIPFVYRLIK